MQLCELAYFRASGEPKKPIRLAVNTKVVLTGTAVLILIGTLAIYALEHGNAMALHPVGNQYLSAFFQSVSLRTAGFNTIPFNSLQPATYILMAAIMFIGGASGGTTGGIKINTAAVMVSYLMASIRDRKTATLYQSSVPTNTVLRAFSILLFGTTIVVLGTIFLTIFEAVSAFGTAGLSAGITGSLSLPGKLTVIVLMYLGRIGPLTVLAAAALGTRKIRIEYPRGDIAIG